jgi:hypothetical protein
VDPGDLTEFEYYPRVHQLSGPSGEFFIAGDTNASGTQLCASIGNGTGETWFLAPPLRGILNGDLRDGPLDLVQGVPRNRYYGSSVLLHQQAANGGKDRVLIFGGSDGCQTNDPSCCNGTVTVLAGVSELSYVPGGTSTLVEKAPLLCPRVFSNAVILPTGDIFISRGSLTDQHNDSVAPLTLMEPHAYAEIYTPSSSKAPGSGSSVYTAAVPDGFVNFCQVTAGTANKRPPRTYHHVTLLLPDGRVLVAGGDPVPGDWEPGQPTSPQCGLYGASGYTLEVFNPPYLYKGFDVNLNLAPSSVLFRQHFNISFAITGSSGAAYIDRVVLIRTGSVTHHQDYSQRYIELGFQTTEQAIQIGNPTSVVGTLRAQGPASALAPPGYYLLFVVGKDGSARVPSEGVFIEVK